MQPPQQAEGAEAGQGPEGEAAEKLPEAEHGYFAAAISAAGGCRVCEHSCGHGMWLQVMIRLVA